MAEQNKLQDLLSRQHACKMRRTQQFCVLICCRTAVQDCLFPACSCPDSVPRQKALQAVSFGKRRTFNHRVRGEENQSKKDKLIENRVCKVKREESSISVFTEMSHSSLKMLTAPSYWAGPSYELTGNLAHVTFVIIMTSN